MLGRTPATVLFTGEQAGGWPPSGGAWAGGDDGLLVDTFTCEQTTAVTVGWYYRTAAATEPPAAGLLPCWRSLAFLPRAHLRLSLLANAPPSSCVLLPQVGVRQVGVVLQDGAAGEPHVRGAHQRHRPGGWRAGGGRRLGALRGTAERHSGKRKVR